MAENNRVFFFTFHKCASTLFKNLVLKSIEDLEHVDFATAIYRNEASSAVNANQRVTVDFRGAVSAIILIFEESLAKFIEFGLHGSDTLL